MKAFFRHPDKPVPIRRELRSVRMWFVAIKHLCNRLALIGCKGSDINE